MGSTAPPELKPGLRGRGPTSRPGPSQTEKARRCRQERSRAGNLRAVDEGWLDWNRATFAPLSENDAELAQRLLGRLVDGFLANAGLSASHREEALRQAGIDEGQTPDGVRILRATLPLGEGHPEYEW